MTKDFDKWNYIKKLLQNKQNVLKFKEGEIWLIHFGVNIGQEQDGGENFKRPILILRKFNKNIFIGIPLTRKRKLNHFHMEISIKQRKSYLILSQIKLFDQKRLITCLGRTSKTNLKNITNFIIYKIFKKDPNNGPFPLWGNKM